MSCLYWNNEKKTEDQMNRCNSAFCIGPGQCAQYIYKSDPSFPSNTKYTTMIFYTINLHHAMPVWMILNSEDVLFPLIAFRQEVTTWLLYLPTVREKKDTLRSWKWTHFHKTTNHLLATWIQIKNKLNDYLTPSKNEKERRKNFYSIFSIFGNHCGEQINGNDFNMKKLL